MVWMSNGGPFYLPSLVYGTGHGFPVNTGSSRHHAHFICSVHRFLSKMFSEQLAQFTGKSL